MAEGQTGTPAKIERLKKGDSSRTARHADVMNEIIDKLNAILSLTVSPTGAGNFIFSDSNGILRLDISGGCGNPPTTGTYVCGAIDGTQQWLSTEECDCGIDGGSA